MATINYLTTVRLDFGAIKGLPEDLHDTGIQRPLIVTDRGVIDAGIVDRVAEFLPPKTPVFADTPANPTEEAIEAALDAYRANECDGLVAIGGGSPMDLAKGVAVLATHGGPLGNYAAVRGGIQRITDKVAPVIAVPTTAGTGSEVGRAAVVSFKDGTKLAVVSQLLIPKRAVCDPELTLGLSPQLTAATGMDTVTHCIETFISPVENPVAAAIAIDGLERSIEALPRAVECGTDRNARRQMMIAAFEGAMAFQKGLGSVHALSHALGAIRELKLHHGTLNSILLPPLLRFNELEASSKYARLRKAMGLKERANVADFMESFSRKIGMPGRLSEIGVPKQVLSSVAAAAVADMCHATNARAATESDYVKILNQAF